jgi:mRNA degradation ribonuclease J1/J2
MVIKKKLIFFMASPLLITLINRKMRELNLKKNISNFKIINSDKFINILAIFIKKKFKKKTS